MLERIIRLKYTLERVNSTLLFIFGLRFFFNSCKLTLSLPLSFAYTCIRGTTSYAKCCSTCCCLLFDVPLDRRAGSKQNRNHQHSTAAASATDAAAAATVAAAAAVATAAAAAAASRGSAIPYIFTQRGKPQTTMKTCIFAYFWFSLMLRAGFLQMH